VEKVKSDVITIISKTFSVPEDSLNVNSGPEDINLWDSLGQLNLISNIEEHFGLTFDYDELFEVISVESIINILQRKLE
tara:strand:+ start:233 stop:469 length:237 start_codon:yes stop_codon:yes gene_type:complete